MNIRVLHKKAKWACTFVVASCFALTCASLAFAEKPLAAVESTSPKNGFIELYKEYANAQYAVRWYASPKSLSTAQEKIARYEYLVLYSSETLLSTSSTTVIQFGFFKSREEAKDFVSSNKLAFPGAEVVAVSGAEHKALFDFTESQSSAGAVDYYWLGVNPEGSSFSFQALLKKAKGFYVSKNYKEALKYYGALSLTQDAETAIWSREVVAVCYERLGNFEGAMEVYRQLLVTYPNNKAAPRVTQRLRALETAASDDQLPLRKSTLKLANNSYWRGSLGQSYTQITRTSDFDEEDYEAMSAVISHFDVHAGVNTGGHKLDVRLNGYNLYDMRDEGDDSKTAIKRFYVNYSHSSGLNIVGGRQKDLSSGVYTSYDGAALRFRFGKGWSVGVSAGVPVYFSDFSSYIDRQFYSLNAGYDFSKRLNLSSYYIQQTFFGETERSAIGGTLKYLSNSFSSYVNMDYDLAFQELNLLTMSVTYLFSANAQTTVDYGYRRNPFLSASNIQIGQPYRDVESYLKRDEFSVQSMLDDALNRTSVYEYGSLSYRYRIDEGLELVTDLYHAVSSELPNYATDDDWLTTYVDSYTSNFQYSSAGIQAIANGFIGKTDTATLSFRHSKTSFSTSDGIHISENLNLGKKISFKPKLSFKNVKPNGEESGQNKTGGSVALLYKPTRSAELRAEMGKDTVKDLEQKSAFDTTYFILGYQARF